MFVTATAVVENDMWSCEHLYFAR